MSRTIGRAGLVGGVVSLLAAAPAPAGQPLGRDSPLGRNSNLAPAIANEPQAQPALVELVETYFRTDGPAGRASLLPAIRAASGNDFAAVADALGRVQVWSPLPDQTGTFSFESADGTNIAVAYILPDTYDPTNRHGLILCMPDRRASPQESLALAKALLDPPAEDSIFVSPQRLLNGSFHQPLSTTADLRRLTRMIRQRMHLDTDRVFLFGYRAGGDAAWMAALSHADLFAGAIIMSGYPRVPYPRQAYPFLMENLGALPILAQWLTPENALPPPNQNAVAAYNRAIIQLARERSLSIVGVETTRGSPTGLRSYEDQVEELLARRRAPAGRAITHWFRYPAHGQTGWLRQVKFEGDVWEAEQLSILPSFAADRDGFISDVIKGNLAYLSGKIEGQTITIETRRCARIDVLVPFGGVDLNQPVTVRCNGRKRYHRPIRPSLRTLLETAYREWEFQRPAVARLSFGIKSSPKG